MKYLLLLLLSIFTCLMSSCAGTTGGSDSETQNRWLVVLGSSKDFHIAKRDAEAYAKTSGIPFSMDGRIFDAKGLRLPEKPDDQIYAGEYLLRRNNEIRLGDRVVPEHLSIEKSDAYHGFAAGDYLIVASIAENKEAAAKLLKQLKPIAPKAYVKKSPIFMGCMF